jgi:aminoglycoside phosphotransferase (APT) family kinase protein
VHPPGLDLDRLAGFLAQHRPDLVAGPLRGELIEGGRSNLTYLVTDGEQEWVLRRPPLGHVLATAHDVAREHRVISALAGTPVPVPATLLLCTDADAIGAPFYLMSKVEGKVYRTAEETAALSGAARETIARRLINTLADLHAVDPATVGLSDFGRPEGFLARQVRRWSGQLAASRSRDLAGIDALATKLAERVPGSGPPAIVHGDYRLDNVLVRDPDNPRISAVLDWEMSTLGDPLTDLGLLLVYWDRLTAHDNPVVEGVGARHGFPDGDTLVSWYAERTGADLSALDWYVAMAAFKLAVILEGIHYRFTLGKTVGDGFDRIGTLVPPLVEIGLDALGGGARGPTR